jgi:hypothetical protein
MSSGTNSSHIALHVDLARLASLPAAGPAVAFSQVVGGNAVALGWSSRRSQRYFGAVLRVVSVCSSERAFAQQVTISIRPAGTLKRAVVRARISPASAGARAGSVKP